MTSYTITAAEMERRRAESKAAAEGKVDLSQLERTVAIHRNDDGTPTVRVTYTAPGLDRNDGPAWSCGTAKTAWRLAARLVAAIRAGVILSDPEVLVDINGNTYVSVSSKILARTMNADLRKLGY